MTKTWGSATAILDHFAVPEDQHYCREYADNDDYRAILSVGQRIANAWKQNDADAFADVFTENGSVLLQDEQLTSREEIRQHMKAGFQSSLRGAHVVGWPVLIRELDDEVALFITEGCILAEGESEPDPERMIRASWVVRKGEAAPELVSHQSSPIKA